MPEPLINQPLTSSSTLVVVLVAFLALAAIELFALYLHVAGFKALEIGLLVVVPLFVYLTALPGVAGALQNIPRLVDIPLFRFDNVTLGVNLIGFFIPVIISANMLLHKRIPWRQTALIVLIISAVTYLYTRFEPQQGIVIYYFAVPPILAAGIAFMLKKMRGGYFNPALVSYSGATFGILIGADILNIYQALTHQWNDDTFISIGGGSVLDAVFLAGVVALGADIVFRSQEENIFGDLVKMLFGNKKA
ncbi:MAG: DUF1614 domain-containing protein [Chloroflexi bacterium]|nr:DUF1614 domain-containing protein [Chloroflexota bacterium]